MQSIGLLPKTGYRDSSFRKRFILKLLSMPSSLVPMLAGLTDLIVLWVSTSNPAPRPLPVWQACFSARESS